jgi:hypothetical protein
MPGPIVRTGATPKFSDNWERIFGGGRAPKSAKSKAPAKSAKTASPKKKAAKKSPKKSPKKKR